MTVYGLLLRWLTPRAAAVVAALVYAFLILAVLYSSINVEPAAFRYVRV